MDFALRLDGALADVEKLVQRGIDEVQILPRIKPITLLVSAYAKHSIYLLLYSSNFN